MNSISIGLLSIFLLFPVFLLSQPTGQLGGLTPFGLQNETVLCLTAESIELGTSAREQKLFSITENRGVFEIPAFEKGSDWDSLGLAGLNLTALTVQHWGVGPRDGLTLFVAAEPKTSVDTVRIYRREVGFLPDTSWTPIPLGIDPTLLRRIDAMESFYYTGHRPPQYCLAGGEHGMIAGAYGNWIDVTFQGALFVKINDVDAAPHWPAAWNEAWGAGQYGVMPAAFRSTDLGRSWSLVQLPSMIEGEAYAVAVNPRSPDSVFIGMIGSIWVSGDTGKSWGTVAAGFPGVRIQAIAFDPFHPGHVYAGGADNINSFVFLHSSDGGENWTLVPPPVNTPLKGISSIVVMDSGEPRFLTRVFISTLGTGVWVYEPFVTTAVGESPPAPAEAQIEIYPNPLLPGMVAGSSVTFRLRAPGMVSGAVRMRIADPLGRIVESRLLDLELQGTTEFTWNPGTGNPGVYMVQLAGASLRLTRPFLVLGK